MDRKVAWVTGAGSGIGAAAARQLAKSGMRVALLARSRDELENVKREIEDGGGEAMITEADVSDAKVMEAAAGKIVEQWGRIDVVIANAGINGVWASLEELTPEDWDQTLGINLKGTFLTVKYAVPHLKKQGGAIVVISSVNGTRMFSNTGATAYSCSKAAQVAFTKMIALELAPHRVRVNVICPGWIETNIEESTVKKNEDIGVKVEFPEGQVPLTGGNPGSAEQVGDLIDFLVSDRASHISGTEMWIDGAQSLLEG